MKFRTYTVSELKIFAICILVAMCTLIPVWFIGNNDMYIEKNIINYYDSIANDMLLNNINKIRNEENIYPGTTSEKNDVISDSNSKNLLEMTVIVHVSTKIILIGAMLIFCAILTMFLPEAITVLLYIFTVILVPVLQYFIYIKYYVYFPSIELLVCLTVMFLTVFIAKISMNKFANQILPISAVINFSSNIINIDENVTYSDYILNNKIDIEKAISAKILMPVSDNSSFIIRELANENKHNRKNVEKYFFSDTRQTNVNQMHTDIFKDMRYIIFIPLPVFDKVLEKQKYTIIGTDKKISKQTAGYISMFLFSMYIYFKAQHERSEHQKIYMSMLSLMISVIDAKDPVTAGHSQRVADISTQIGKWMNLNIKEQYDLEFTAILHDIGKIGVSDYVLNKPSVYTRNDFEQMKHHTVRGSEMLREVGMSEEIIDGIRHHHERIDGKGYPDGIKGKDIHEFAKIIKIADVYDALTSKRQYKEAWTVDKALDIIYRGRGTEFDPDIADIFITNMMPEGWKPSEKDKNSISVTEDKYINCAVDIANDFYEKYHIYICKAYPMQSKQAMKINLEQVKSFMNLDWGETFNNPEFLKERPVILAYENDTESLLFGQACYREGVEGIYFYFFKGFLNMGIYLLKPNEINEIKLKLLASFGKPYEINENTSGYISDKIRIILLKTRDEQYVLVYISEYMCANYIFSN